MSYKSYLCWSIVLLLGFCLFVLGEGVAWSFLPGIEGWVDKKKKLLLPCHHLEKGSFETMWGTCRGWNSDNTQPEFKGVPPSFEAGKAANMQERRHPLLVGLKDQISAKEIWRGCGTESLCAHNSSIVVCFGETIIQVCLGDCQNMAPEEQNKAEFDFFLL